VPSFNPFSPLALFREKREAGRAETGKRLLHAKLDRLHREALGDTGDEPS